MLRVVIFLGALAAIGVDNYDTDPALTWVTSFSDLFLVPFLKIQYITLTPSAALLPIRTLDDAPCRRGAFLPHTLRFEPRVSRTSALFVARIGKRPHPEAE